MFCIDSARVGKLSSIEWRAAVSAALRKVNAQCYHPCIVQFIKTFQDSATPLFSRSP